MDEPPVISCDSKEEPNITHCGWPFPCQNFFYLLGHNKNSTPTHSMPDELDICAAKMGLPWVNLHLAIHRQPQGSLQMAQMVIKVVTVDSDIVHIFCTHFPNNDRNTVIT